MLSPEYLNELPDALTELWRQAEEDILRDVARRIGKMGGVTETAAWQLWRFEETQALHQDVVRTLARYSGKSDAEIRRLLEQAGADTLAADDALYCAMGFSPADINSSPALLNLLNSGYRQTRGTWENLTGTTANTVTRQFEGALDRAWLQVSTGAFDYDTAIKRAVDGLAQHMDGVTYPSGHHDTLEVAVRRAVLTGVNQTCGKLQIARMDEMECEFVEVTAHAGARPTHAEWQGKVYHRGGAATYKGRHYPDFESSTGYGTGDGLCGWNCRHNFYPYWPGLSERNHTDAELAALNEKCVAYNGRMYTKYEISQMQRAAERKVRTAKRKYLAESEAGVDAAQAAVQLRTARQQLKQFIRDTGGQMESARTSVAGFGRSEAGRAAWAAKSILTKADFTEVSKSSILRLAKTDKNRGVDDIEITWIGQMNPLPLRSVFGELRTTDVIITNERIAHIKERHPQDYSLFEAFGSKAVEDPDLILQDTKHLGTVFAIKKLPETNLNVVLRLALDIDDPTHKNSVMTFYRIREKNLVKLIEKSPMLYKRE